MALMLSVILISSLITLVWWISKPKANRKLLPPGPPADPIIGHVRLVPSTRPELTYLKLAREYNTDILYINLLGKPVIMLHSAEAATALLEKRGSIYSGRPRMHFFEEAGWIFNFGFFPMGPVFRKHRKMVQNAFAPAQCVPYRAAQQQEARLLARRILETPDKWQPHLLRFSTTIIIRIIYGITIKDEDDPYLDLAIKVAEAMGNGGGAGVTSVDILPIIRYLPQWLSIFPALKFARKCFPSVRALHDLPFSAAKNDIANGVAETSFVSKMLEEQKEIKDSDEELGGRITDDDINGTSGAVLIAGQDTTWATLAMFMLNMTLHPEVQEKAWEEIESVIGIDRLPTFDDHDKLPYVECVMQETLRRNPVAPLGVPHTLEEDDTYKGYFIPKADSVCAGSMVFGNTYAISRDERVYKDPESFNPDRFLSVEKGGANEPLPVGPFGFGRRICPGRHLATASVWIAIATILATFKILKAKDKDGNEITPPLNFTSGIVSHPDEFPFILEPRSQKAAELLNRAH